jgi:hypothetical protein
LISLFVILVIGYALLATLLYFHIGWWTKRFKYPELTKNALCYERLGLVIAGVLVILPFTFLILSTLFEGVADFLVNILNLNSRETNRDLKDVTKLFGAIFLFLICVGIWILPIIG